MYVSTSLKKPGKPMISPSVAVFASLSPKPDKLVGTTQPPNVQNTTNTVSPKPLSVNRPHSTFSSRVSRPTAQTVRHSGGYFFFFFFNEYCSCLQLQLRIFIEKFFIKCDYFSSFVQKISIKMLPKLLYNHICVQTKVLYPKILT